MSDWKCATHNRKGKRGARYVHFRFRRALYAVAVSFFVFVNSKRAVKRIFNVVSLEYETMPQCRLRAAPEEQYFERLLSHTLSGSYKREPKALCPIDLDTRVYFVLNLANSEAVIPSLLSNVLKICLHVNTTSGYPSCFISVYESGSVDQTHQLLRIFAGDLKRLGIAHEITTGGEVRKRSVHRIDFLSKVRNMAMQPFYRHSHQWDEVVFLNDVFMCATDIYTLIKQKHTHRADVVSGMDYVFQKGQVLFYDTWVTRDMSGQSFQNSYPFIRDSGTQALYSQLKPFQVFTTWAGGVVFSANLLQENPWIRFRSPELLECATCEVDNFMRDLWFASGRRGLRVLVVPEIFVTYERSAYSEVRKFYLRTLNARRHNVSSNASNISFIKKPPEVYECRGMDFPGEQLVDSKVAVAQNPWQWGYSSIWRNSTLEKSAGTSLREILRRAVGFYKKQCKTATITPLSDSATDETIPEVINFILLSDNPKTFPRHVFMNMLRWVQLHPCFTVNIHDRSSLDQKIPISWSRSLKNLTEIPDPFIRHFKSSDWYRILGFMAVFVEGGIFTDGEVMPTSKFSLNDLRGINVAFDERTYAGGPYILAAPCKAVKLREIISSMLQNNMDFPEQIQSVIANSQKHSVKDVLYALSSVRTGRNVFTRSGLSHSSKLAHTSILLTHHNVPRIVRTSIFHLGLGEVMLDGEFVYSIDKHSTTNSNFNDRAHSILWLRSSSVNEVKQDLGCLEVFSSVTGQRVYEKSRLCWSSNDEMDVVYGVNQDGVLKIYSAPFGCSNLVSVERRLLLSAKLDKPSMHVVGDPLVQKGSFLGHFHGEDEVQGRCSAEMFSVEICKRFYNISLRGMLRQQNLCQAI